LLAFRFLAVENFNRMNKSEFESKYLAITPTKESIEKQERAFNAMMAYEKNCIAKYDYPDNTPSKPIPRGERMEDFACKYGTTIKEMKACGLQVDRALANSLQRWVHEPVLVWLMYRVVGM
jgi:hypothetical protein